MRLAVGRGRGHIRGGGRSCRSDSPVHNAERTSWCRFSTVGKPPSARRARGLTEVPEAAEEVSAADARRGRPGTPSAPGDFRERHRRQALLLPNVSRVRFHRGGLEPPVVGMDSPHGNPARPWAGSRGLGWYLLPYGWRRSLLLTIVSVVSARSSVSSSCCGFCPR